MDKKKSKKIGHRKDLNFWLSLSLVMCGMLRCSVFVKIIPGLDRLLLLGSASLLVVLCVLAVNAHRKYNAAAIVMCLSWLPGSMSSDYGIQAFYNCVVLLLLVLSVGPAFFSKKMMIIRSMAWKYVMWFSFGVGVLSSFWWVLPLPTIGVGFSGVVTHANMLGPLAAISVVGALCRVTRGGGKVWWGIFLLSIIPLLLSGSRSAVLAALGGVLVICLLDWHRLRKYLPICVILAIVFSVLPESSMTSLTGRLNEKGFTADTRMSLWETRLREFKHNRIIGVGVGVGAGEGTMVNSDGEINVEPGSSYLALLSMTGIAGTLCFAFFICSLLIGMIQHRRKLPPLEVCEMMAVMVVLLINTGFEGWMLAVGSPLCLVFWLLTGHMGDRILMAQNRSSRHRLRKSMAVTPEKKMAV